MFSLSDILKSRGRHLIFPAGLSHPAQVLTNQIACFTVVIIADDTQLYLSFKPQNLLHQESAVKAMEDCIDELRNCMDDCTSSFYSK
jgi:hypothetical protein